MKFDRGSAVFGCGLLATALVTWGAPAVTEPASPAGRLARLQVLQARLEHIESIHAIERLQYIYGYYQDRFLYDQVATLFTDRDAEVHWLGGVWTGRAGVRRLWLGYARSTYAAGAKGPVAGRLFDLPQWQGVVTVAPDGQTAKGRFRTLGKFAVYRQQEFWISGVYENDYVREGGVWKIKVMRFCSPWSAVYTDGWQNADAAQLTPRWSPPPAARDRPDRMETMAQSCRDHYPQAGVLPFHFDDPAASQPAVGPPASAVPDGALLPDLSRRADAVNDLDAIERLHHIYAWQQDYMLFNFQADLFSDDPRAFTRYKLGIYQGKEGARRVWAGRFGGFTNHADMPVYGAMIDHHQAQGVITLAPDGRSAQARYRTSADSFFSDFGKGLSSEGQTSGGADQSVIYENQYVKEAGVWKVLSVDVCIYAEGAISSGVADLPVAGRLGAPADAPADYWKSRARTRDDPQNWNDLYPGNPIGPDRIETPEQAGCFFAKNQTMIHSILVPFHFPNPVTGLSVLWKNQ
jgi:hypothetical protein